MSGNADDFEAAIKPSAADTVASFTERKGFLAKLQHALHVNPALVPLFVLLVSIILFALLLGSRFLSPFALTLILQQVQIVGIVAAAQSLVILTAGIDLSVGAIAVLSSVIMGQFTFRYGLPVEVSVALGLAFGTIIGSINGWLVAVMKLPPFIVTLGMWQIVLAANFLYSANETIRSQDIEQNAPLLQFLGSTFKIGADADGRGGATFTFGVIAMVLIFAFLAYALKRLGPHWTYRFGQPDLRPIAQHRKHHGCRDRRYLTIRWARVYHGAIVWGPHRRCLYPWPSACRRRRAMDVPSYRRAYHRCMTLMENIANGSIEPILKGRGLVKRYGKVTALDHCDFDLYPGEILAVIGDNGAGKSSLIKAVSGAVTPDEGEVFLEGKQVHFTSPIDARKEGIETVYQTLAMSPALSIADNMFMGREIRKPGFRGKWLRQLDRPKMEQIARDKLSELGLMTIQNINQAVETLSGGQRQGVAVARAAAFGSKVIILDEPTAALGVKESRRVLELILDVRSRGIPIILISHNMPHVFEVADRIHVHRLGKRLCVIDPKDYTMSDAVAFMTGAKEAPA